MAQPLDETSPTVRWALDGAGRCRRHEHEAALVTRLDRAQEHVAEELRRDAIGHHLVHVAPHIAVLDEGGLGAEVGIVDADGALAPEAGEFAFEAFADTPPGFRLGEVELDRLHLEVRAVEARPDGDDPGRGARSNPEHSGEHRRPGASTADPWPGEGC